MITDRQAAARRRELVDTLRRKGITDAAVLEAVGAVPRHRFVPDTGLHRQAYDDVALPIGEGQTISQPFTVARMTELLGLRPGERVLEVGTGSGYQAAILATLGARVFSVERHEPLLRRTRPVLRDLGLSVRTRAGDGTLGWPGYAPFDAVVVTAGGPQVPPELRSQLREPADGKPDARMLIPVGPPRRQVLYRVTRTGPDAFTEETFDDVVFVPLVGDRRPRGRDGDLEDEGDRRDMTCHVRKQPRGRTDGLEGGTAASRAGRRPQGRTGDLGRGS